MEYSKDPLVSLTLPNTAGPNDAAIQLEGGNLPACMVAAGYVSGIFFRPNNTQTGVLLTDKPIYFMAQKSIGVAVIEQMDQGFLIYDPVLGYCDFVVIQQNESTNFGPNQQVRIRFGVIAGTGGTLPLQGGSIAHIYDSVRASWTNGNENWQTSGVQFDTGTAVEFREGSNVYCGSSGAGTLQTAQIPYALGDAQASALTALVVANTLLPVSYNLTTLRNTDVFYVQGIFDFERIAAGASVAVGELYVDGVLWNPTGTARQAIFSASVVGERATTPQQWRVFGLSVGSHTFTLGAHATAAGVWRANAIHTSLDVDPRY